MFTDKIIRCEHLFLSDSVDAKAQAGRGGLLKNVLKRKKGVLICRRPCRSFHETAVDDVVSGLFLQKQVYTLECIWQVKSHTWCAMLAHTAPL